MIFFTSDHHFGHYNILKHQEKTRVFPTIHEMNKHYIDTWNSQVTFNDTVYHLGDFAFRDPGKYLEKLNGKIKIIPGNHDRWVKKNKTYVSKKGKTVEILPLIHILKVDKNVYPPIVLCHYPMYSWPHSCYSSWHLHGHSHCDLNHTRFAMHVGVDGSGGRLYSLGDVKKEIMWVKRYKTKETKCHT